MKIRGNVLKTRIAFVEKHFGQDGWLKVLNSMSAEDQHALKGILSPASWFSFELGKRLDEAIVQVLGGGNPEVFERIGAQSARENLEGMHRPFLQPGHPQKFLEKTGHIYSFYYDTGRRDYQPVGSQEGLLTTYDAETFSEADCLTIIGWHKEALKMCGAEWVEMREEECRAKGAPTCRYRIRWRLPGEK